MIPAMRGNPPLGPVPEACSHEPETVNYPGVMIAPGQALPRVHMMICCPGTRRYGLETSMEGCLRRKKNEKKNNKVEEFQLTKFASLGSLASNDVRHRVDLEKKSHSTLSIVIKLPINQGF